MSPTCGLWCGAIPLGRAGRLQALLRRRPASSGKPRAVRYMTALSAVLLGGSALVLTGCGMLTAGGQANSRSTVAAPPSTAARSLEQAESLAREGKSGIAQQLYSEDPRRLPAGPSGVPSTLSTGCPTSRPTESAKRLPRLPGNVHASPGWIP